MELMQPVWPAVGTYHGLPSSVYFGGQPPEIERRIVSKSMLWDFSRNPARWLASPPKSVTDAMRFGSLVDCLLLTPDRFASAYAMTPDSYISTPGNYVLTTSFEGEWNGRQKVCREWKAAREAEGLEVLTPEQLAEASAPRPWNWNSDTCKAWRAGLADGVEIISKGWFEGASRAVANLHARPEVAEMLDGAATQVAMRYDFDERVHGISGLEVPAKGLIDVVPDYNGPWGSHLVDLKTTGKLDDLRQIERTIFEFGYHAQAALYLDMWNALTGEDRESFAFVFQLVKPPYEDPQCFEVAVLELDPQAIIAGRQWYLGAVAQWAECITTSVWPSPWDGVRTVGIPDWAYRKEAA